MFPLRILLNLEQLRVVLVHRANAQVAHSEVAAAGGVEEAVRVSQVILDRSNYLGEFIDVRWLKVNNLVRLHTLLDVPHIDAERVC